jgi:hypothetical protein
MADLNQDLMTAKVPHWFTRLSGWEARLVALKADIALVFGVKPDTKDGDACMKVRVRGGGQAACRGRLRPAAARRLSPGAGVRGPGGAEQWQVHGAGD